MNICLSAGPTELRHRENLSVQIRRSKQPIPSCHAPVPSPVSVLALPTAAKLCLRVATREPNVETHKPSCRWPRSTSCRQQATGTWRTTRYRRGRRACRPPRSGGQSPAYKVMREAGARVDRQERGDSTTWQKQWCMAKEAQGSIRHDECLCIASTILLKDDN